MMDSSLKPEAESRLIRPPGLVDVAQFWGMVFEYSPPGLLFRFWFAILSNQKMFNTPV